MAEITCPWCEAEFMTAVLEMDEGQCPDCLTSWRFEEEPVRELAMAA